MRRATHVICFSAIALLACLQTASLWTLYWQSPSHATSISLSQGCIRVWSSNPGDLPGTPGFTRAGWTGDVLLWKPELSTQSRLWVIPSAPPGVTPMARRLTGFCLILPIAYPLALVVTGTGLSLLYPRLLRARRLSRNRCPSCGYDMTGSAGKCPECGSLLSLFLACFRRRVRHAHA